ncbi:MAG: ATP-binding protein [Rhodopseudomonas palustris]|nr:ATP-binding protein [Rhodopseudomonas palustris]
MLRDNRSVFREKGLALKVEGGGRRVEALADRDKLYEAFSNILHNALKFTEHGGITVRLLPEDGRCRIEFEDSGPGIPADLQKPPLHAEHGPARGPGSEARKRPGPVHREGIHDTAGRGSERDFLTRTGKLLPLHHPARRG